jgi:hypothetical protein
VGKKTRWARAQRWAKSAPGAGGEVRHLKLEAEPEGRQSLKGSRSKGKLGAGSKEDRRNLRQILVSDSLSINSANSSDKQQVGANIANSRKQQEGAERT